MIRNQYFKNKIYKSTYKDNYIRGSAKTIAVEYLNLSHLQEGAEKEMLLQHAEHWFRIENGYA